jgi:hypothetical protein
MDEGEGMAAERAGASTDRGGGGRGVASVGKYTRRFLEVKGQGVPGGVLGNISVLFLDVGCWLDAPKRNKKYVAKSENERRARSARMEL